MAREGEGIERRDVGTRGTAARPSRQFGGRGREGGIRRLARALLEALK